MSIADDVEGGNRGLEEGSLNEFALNQYKKHGSVFEYLTPDDVTMLFDLYRDLGLAADEHGIRQIRYLMFISEVYKSVKIISKSTEDGECSDICKRIIIARENRAKQQGDQLAKLSASPVEKLRTIFVGQVQQTRMYKRYDFDNLVTIDENYAKLHIVWTVYWDFQNIRPSINPLYETVRALTDCDGVSLAVTKELLERDVYSDDQESVLPWFERILTKPVGHTREPVYSDGELVEHNSKDNGRKKIRFVDYIAKIEAEDYFGCRKLLWTDKAFKIAALQDGEAVFKHNRHLLSMQVPAETFLNTDSFNENSNSIFSSINEVEFVSRRGAVGLNFRVENDDTRFRLTTVKINPLDSKREFVIERYDTTQKIWIAHEKPGKEYLNKIIRVQGILYSTLYLPKIEVPNHFGALFDIHITHKYTDLNYPVYACPVAGVPSDIEVLFPHDCSFYIEKIETPESESNNTPKILYLQYICGPDRGNGVPISSRSRHSSTFGPSPPMLWGGGKTRNVETISVLAALAFIVAFIPRSV